MKITCDYCGNLFDDTHATCPHCGAPNKGVVRKSGGQPITIDELAQWYADRHLPPYETTRFFIGQDYRGPRAFGIYKDEATGNFVVYKNKDSGQRAVRYEGTDEAYAVNELYQRLKQEIIQQKSANVRKREGGSNPPPVSSSSSRARRPSPVKASKKKKSGGPLALIGRFWYYQPKTFLGTLGMLILQGAILLFGGIALLAGAMLGIALLMVVVLDSPDDGYYRYDGSTYYYYYMDSSWFEYDDADSVWIETRIDHDDVPKELRRGRSAGKYLLSAEWTESLNVPDFSQTLYYQDKSNNFKVDTGYYRRDDITYYHARDIKNYGWFWYDEDDEYWHYISPSDVPEEFQHNSLADDFFYVAEWDSSTQVTDFLDSPEYESYLKDISSNSSSNNSSSNDSWDDDDDDDYTWDSGDTWDSGGTDWDSDW